MIDGINEGRILARMVGLQRRLFRGTLRAMTASFRHKGLKEFPLADC